MVGEIILFLFISALIATALVRSQACTHTTVTTKAQQLERTQVTSLDLK